MASFQDIAQEVGCTKATVSYVFNNIPQVGEETRRKVLAAAKRLNYQARKKTEKLRIAVVSSTTEFKFDYYGNAMLLSVFTTLNELGCDTQIVKSAEMLRSGRFRGAIIIGAPISMEEIKDIAGIIPCVIINRPYEGLNSVYSRSGEAVFQAMELLHQYGHGKVGFLIPDKSGVNIVYKQRLQGYLRAVKQFSMEFDEQLIQEFRSTRSDTSGIVEIIAKLIKPEPTAIIAAAEGLDIIVNYGLYILDKKIPDDISVISFENDRSFIHTPPHTTISQDFKEIGRHSANQLMALIKGQNIEPVHEAIDCEIIQRDSVKDLHLKRKFDLDKI